MKYATYMDQLTAAGIDAKVASAHAKALEAMLDDKLVTKDYLDAKLSAQTGEIMSRLYQALLVQTVGIAGLVLAVLKLAH